VFDPPALSVVAAARREAEKYRERLRECYGPDIPEDEVGAFKRGFLRGCKLPDGSRVGYVTNEAYATGFRAGQRRWSGRDTGERREQLLAEDPEAFVDAADAMMWYAEGGPDGGDPRPETAPLSSVLDMDDSRRKAAAPSGRAER
jgi:hypothetical protein